jgi:hypothetical protein
MNVLSAIAQGITPDIGGRIRQAQADQRQNALLQFVQQNGPALMGGDQNALAQLYGLDPGLAMQMQAQQQGLDMERQRLELSRRQTEAGIANDEQRLQLARQSAAQEAARHAAQMSAYEREQNAADAARRGAAARVAWQQGAEAWDRWNDDNKERILRTSISRTRRWRLPRSTVSRKGSLRRK